MIDKQYENELLHEIDHIQRQVKELEEENTKLRSSTPLLAEIKIDTEEIYNRVKKDLDDCKKLLDFHIQAFPVLNNQCALYKKAFELACEEINSRECTTLPNPVCKVTCEYSEVCLGSTSWYEMLLKKAGEEND